ncbi:hypothetical protein [Kitasatospora sp. NPDC050463]|uniref:hypothetical protein n=1 Tax=Kitasatospora sp. NPDC050463 TaxID=3155786 RepID=UPI0034117674
MKVGITNLGTTRLADHRRAGWQTTPIDSFETGVDAYDVEQAVLRRVRVDMGIPPFVPAEQMR